MRIILLVLLTAGLSGCASAKFKKDMNTWQNHHVDEYIMSHQAPSSIYELDNGTKVYTFIYDAGGRYVSTGGGLGYMTASSCKMELYTDVAKMIQGWKAEGNSCW